MSQTPAYNQPKNNNKNKCREREREFDKINSYFRVMELVDDIDKHQTTLNVHQLIRIDSHISKYSLYMPISTLEELKEICNICLDPKG